jgi:hypothetical protein
MEKQKVFQAVYEAFKEFKIDLDDLDLDDLDLDDLKTDLNSRLKAVNESDLCFKLKKSILDCIQIINN